MLAEFLMAFHLMSATPLAEQLIAHSADCATVSTEACYNQALDATVRSVNADLQDRGLYSRISCTLFEDYSGYCVLSLPSGNERVDMLDPDDNLCMTDWCVERVSRGVDFPDFGHPAVNLDMFYLGATQ